MNREEQIYNVSDVENIAPIKEKSGITFRILKFDIPDTYEYVKTGKVFSFFSNLLYYLIAYPIIKIYTKISYGVKIYGLKNIDNIDNTGAITVANHVLVTDAAIIGTLTGKNSIYFTTQESNFKIPVIRKIIKYLKGIPIPTKLSKQKNFKKQLDAALKNNKVIHFFPEGKCIPYCKRVRDFKKGAFIFSKENNVPIVPIVFKFKSPNGLFKKIRKYQVDVVVLKKVEPEDKTVNVLKEEVWEKMNKELLNL